MKKVLYSLMISMISIGLIAMILTCKDAPLAVILPLERVTTDNIVPGEKHIVFSLSNPNSRAMQVTFSISPEARAASYSAGGTSFNPRSLELGANENKSIRIAGLASSQEYTITIMNSENVGNTNATNTVITVTTTADVTPPNPVTTDIEVAGEQHIAFLLINPNTEAVQVAFSLSPAVSTASFSVDGTAFNPLSENVELTARGEADIRIEGLASSTPYTITMTTTDNAGNTNATDTMVMRTTRRDRTPPEAKVTTDNIEPGGDYIAFSLSNPNAEAVQVTFIRLNPTVITASYSVEGTSFDPLIENVELGANENKPIRIEGLDSLTEYTITMKTKDTNDNAHDTDTEITATTTADVTPPAETVVKSNVQPGGNQIAFILINPNTEEVQVAFSLSPTVSTATYAAGGTSFEPTNLMLAPRNAQRIIIGGLARNTSYTITMTTKDNVGNAHASNTVITTMTLSDVTPPANPVTTNNIVAGEQDIAFSLSNPNAETVQVAFSLSPEASAASYSAEGTSFNPQTEDLELGSNENKGIRIAGLASSTSYTITLETKDNAGNAHTTNIVIMAMTLADRTPPAQEVRATNVQTIGNQIAFSLSNPNAEGVQVTFSISPAASAASYSAEGTSFNPTSLLLGSNENKAIRIGGLASGITYRVTMTTKDNAGNAHATATVVTARTAADNIPPAEPVVANDIFLATNQTIVTFSLSNPNAERVEVTFNLNPTASSVIYEAGGNPFDPTNTGQALTAMGEADIRITGLTRGTTYTLTLTTKDNAGNAHATETVVRFSSTPKPTQAPTNFVVLGRNKQVILSWTPASNVATNAMYVIYRSNRVLTTVTEPGYYDTNVVNGRQYRYKVAEINDGGEGPFTPEKSISPKATPDFFNVDTPRSPRAKPGFTLRAEDDFDGPSLNTNLWTDLYIAGRTAHNKARATLIFGQLDDAQRNTGIIIRINNDHPNYRGDSGLKVSSIQSGQRFNLHKIQGMESLRATTPTFYHLAPIYGYFELRGKQYIPSGANKAGYHIAWWTLGAQYRLWQRTEIDIWEDPSRDPARTVLSIKGDPGGQNIPDPGVRGRTTRNIPNVDGEFHIWGIDIRPNRVSIIVDGKEVFSSDNGVLGYAHYPHVHLLSHYENAGWTGNASDPRSDANRDFQVDYFRAYQHNEPVQGVTGPGRYMIQWYISGHSIMMTSANSRIQFDAAKDRWGSSRIMILRLTAVGDSTNEYRISKLDRGYGYMSWHNNALRTVSTTNTGNTVWTIERCPGTVGFSYDEDNWAWTYTIRQGSDQYLGQKFTPKSGEPTIWNGTKQVVKRIEVKTGNGGGSANNAEFHFDTITDKNNIQDKHRWIISRHGD